VEREIFFVPLKEYKYFLIIFETNKWRDLLFGWGWGALEGDGEVPTLERKILINVNNIL